MFDAIFPSIGIAVVRTEPQAPQMNAFAEHCIASVRRQCTDRLLITGEHHLRTVLDADTEHYNTGRSHRDGLHLHAPNDDPTVRAFPAQPDRILRRRVLGGLLDEYQSAA